MSKATRRAARLKKWGGPLPRWAANLIDFDQLEAFIGEQVKVHARRALPGVEKHDLVKRAAIKFLDDKVLRFDRKGPKGVYLEVTSDAILAVLDKVGLFDQVIARIYAELYDSDKLPAVDTDTDTDTDEE